jgi:hypothetical protein
MCRQKNAYTIGSRQSKQFLRESEIDLHRSVAEFLDWVILPPTVWTTFPAGWGRLGRATAGRLRACGLKEGMPDILVFHHGGTIGIELKTLAGKPSAVQLQMANRLLHAGVPVHICRSINDVHRVLVPLVAMRACHGSFVRTGAGGTGSD